MAQPGLNTGDVFIRTGYASVIRTQDKVSKVPIKAGTINP